jgi:hypothetical protein
LGDQVCHFAIRWSGIVPDESPFFLGLILGHFSVAGFWLIVDQFTGMTDNALMWL